MGIVRYIWLLTQSKFDELVQNLGKMLFGHNLYTFLFKTQNLYFWPNNFKLLFLKNGFLTLDMISRIASQIYYPNEWKYF